MLVSKFGNSNQVITIFTITKKQLWSTPHFEPDQTLILLLGSCSIPMRFLRVFASNGRFILDNPLLLLQKYSVALHEKRSYPMDIPLHIH